MSLASSVFSFDWLSITIFAPEHEVLPFVKLLGLDEGLADVGHGTQGFARLQAGQGGFRFSSEPGAGRIYCSLSLPGKALDFVGVERLRLFHDALCEAGLNGLRWQVSRCDLAFDTQDFTVAAVAAARAAGEVLCSSRKFDERKNFAGKEQVGHTLYFGARTSTAMLRVYHKTDGSSFGSDAFTRVELELKEDRATAAYLTVMAAELKDWATMAGRLLVGYFTVLADWWVSWVEGFAAAWLKLRRRVPSVAGIKKWLYGQVSASLAVYVAAVSSGEIEGMISEFRALLDDGREKFSKRHTALISGYSGEEKTDFAVFAF